MGTFLPVADGDGVADAADVELVRRVHRGDEGAFAELWVRHYRHGLAATEALTGRPDPALVAEAHSRIGSEIQAGTRPRGAFRAQLLAGIFTVASERGLASSTRPHLSDGDRAAADAYRELFADQQELLWYSEIEGMTPAMIAPLVHSEPTAVAKLTAGARRELRRVWAIPHIDAVDAESPCRWTREHLPGLAEAPPHALDAERAREHLSRCRACTLLAAESEYLPARLASGVLSLTLGTAAGEAYRAAVLDTGVLEVQPPPTAPLPGREPTAVAAATPALLGEATPADIAARAPVTAEPSVAPRAATARMSRRERMRRRTASGVGLTAVLAAGVIVAGGVAVTASMLGPFSPESSEATADDTQPSARETMAVPRPSRSAATVPADAVEGDPPAPLVPEDAPPAAAPPVREEAAPQPRAPFTVRDDFLPRAPVAAAPAPSSARPRAPSRSSAPPAPGPTPVVPAPRPTQPTAPSRPAPPSAPPTTGPTTPPPAAPATPPSAPGPEEGSGQDPAPEQGQEPGQDTAPGQDSPSGQDQAPAQDTAPGGDSAPGQDTAPGQNQEPVQEPDQGPAPDEEADVWNPFADPDGSDG